MDVRLTKLSAETRKGLSGIPSATLAVAFAEHGEQRQVSIVLSAVDCWGIGHVVATLALSPNEARRISADLARCADTAEREG